MEGRVADLAVLGSPSTEVDSMHARTLLAIFLTLVGCGLNDAVVVEVDADPSFMGRIDRLELAQPSSASSGFARSVTGNPVALPTSFTIALDDVRATVEQQGGLSLTARAWWRTVKIGQGAPSEPDTLSGWVTFRHSPVKLTLTTRSLDLLRHCESDDRCATSYCGSENFSKSLTFCTKHCAVDSDCPGQAKCSNKYGVPICIPTCTSAMDVCQVFDPPLYPFPDWQCNTDHDGLCGFTP